MGTRGKHLPERRKQPICLTNSLTELSIASKVAYHCSSLCLHRVLDRLPQRFCYLTVDNSASLRFCVGGSTACLTIMRLTPCGNSIAMHQQNDKHVGEHIPTCNIVARVLGDKFHESKAVVNLELVPFVAYHGHEHWVDAPILRLNYLQIHHSTVSPHSHCVCDATRLHQHHEEGRMHSRACRAQCDTTSVLGCVLKLMQNSQWYPSSRRPPQWS